MKMLDGVRPAKQFYPDVQRYERVFAVNPEAFKVGFYGYMYKRTWVGWNDPLAWFNVVDALVRATAGYAITPGHLTSWVNREYGATWFTTQVVGRIMSGIHSMMYKTLVEHHGEKILPFEKYSVSERKKYYCLDGPESVKVYGEDVGRLLLMALRRRLLIMVRATMYAEKTGKFHVYPDIEDRLMLDPEDMQWKEIKVPLKKASPPRPPSHQ